MSRSDLGNRSEVVFSSVSYGLSISFFLFLVKSLT